MTIENLGVKLYSGTKADRKSDSLGSAADGANTGITLVKSGGSVTGSPTTDLSSAIGSWTKVPDSGSFLAVDSGNNEIDVAYGSSANNAINYDLGGGSNLGTKFTVRFEYQITGYSGLGNYMQFAVGLTSGTSNCIQNSNDFAVASNTAGSSLNRWRIHTGKNDQVSGGAGNGIVSAFTTTSSATTYYMEIARDGEFFQITFFTDNSYSTVSESIQGSSSGTYNLRYLQASIYEETSGGGTYTSSIRNIKYWNNQAKFNGDVKLGTGAYSFDGSNDYVECGTTSDWKFLHDGSKSTIAFWAKLDDTSQGDPAGIICTSNINNSSTGTAVFISNGDEICYLTNNGSTSTQNSQNIFTIPDTDWHHYTFTYDGSLANTNLVFYFDGVQKATGNKQNTFATGNSTNPLRIGRGNSVYFGGELDDIGIYKRVLTATEISDLANQGSADVDIDFTEYSDQTAADNAWASSDTAKVRANPSTDVLDFTNTRDNTNDTIVHDIGTANISDTWVLRFKINGSTWTTGGQSVFNVGLSGSDESVNDNDGQHWIGIEFRNNSGERRLGVTHQAGSSGHISSANNSNVAYNWADSTDYFVELKRVSSSSIVATVWTGSFGGTQVATKENTTSNSSVANLRYFKVANVTTTGVGNSEFIGTIDNIQLYDGVTSIPYDGASVSSLSDKSGLKAYYSMDSTAITSAPSSADWSEDFSTGSASHSSDGQTLNGWYASNHTRSYFDGSNNYGKLSMHSSTNTALSFDLEQSGNGGLGTSINATNWTLRFRWHIISKASDHTNGTQGFIGLANTAGGSPSAIDGMGMSMVQAVSSGDKVINAISDNTNPMNYGGSGSSDRHIALEVSNGDDYWVQITRDGDTEILSIYNDADYSDLVSSNSKTVSGVTGLRYFLAQSQNDSSAGYTTMYVDDIKFYDGVSIKDGCANDFSSTSDLEGLTGIRTNSIFQQTDDTPTYWWYNGTSWVLDGTTLAINEDFSENNFTSNDTNVTNVVDGALTYWGAGQNQYGKGAYYKTPVTLNDNKWVMRARYEIEGWSSPSGDSYQVYVGMIKFTTAANAQGVSSSYNQDGISFGHRIGTGTNGIRIGASDVGGQLYNNFETLTSLTGTRTCWIELTRLSSTTSKLEVFSDEGFTTSIGATPTLTHGAVTGLDTIMINSSQGNGTGGSNHGNIDNLQIQNGTSEWLE